MGNMFSELAGARSCDTVRFGSWRLEETSSIQIHFRNACRFETALARTNPLRMVLDGSAGALTEAITEVESGRNDDERPRLAGALDGCRLTGAVLVIAKLDRLSRDAHFLLELEKAGVEFVA